MGKLTPEELVEKMAIEHTGGHKYWILLMSEEKEYEMDLARKDLKVVLSAINGGEVVASGKWVDGTFFVRLTTEFEEFLKGEVK